LASHYSHYVSFDRVGLKKEGKEFGQKQIVPKNKPGK